MHSRPPPSCRIARPIVQRHLRIHTVCATLEQRMSDKFLLESHQHSRNRTEGNTQRVCDGLQNHIPHEHPVNPCDHHFQGERQNRWTKVNPLRPVNIFDIKPPRSSTGSWSEGPWDLDLCIPGLVPTHRNLPQNSGKHRLLNTRDAEIHNMHEMYVKFAG